ncbi:MAG: tetratricopeptide repeat protein [Bacteroidales bacterium]|nr:tetratricopeptide repeat protein [Bacteroidales bacterium]
MAQIETDSLDLKLGAAKNDSLRERLLLDFIEFHYRNEPERCERLTEQLIELSKDNGDSSNLAYAYSFAGVINKNKGEYSKALEFHFKSEQINLKSENKKALATNYNDIGIIYKTLGEYDKALDYYKKSNAIAIDLGYKRAIVMTYNNIGTIYEAKSDYDNAVKYFELTYAKAIEFDVLQGQAIALSNLGEISGTKGDDNLARSYFKKALIIDHNTKDKFGQTISMMNIAGTFFKMGPPDSALFYLAKAESNAKELNAKQQLISIYNGISDTYEKTGDYHNALKARALFARYQDSLYNETKAKQLVDAETKYAALKKDREIENLRNEQVIAEVKQKQYQSERIAWISLFVMGIITLYFLYKRHRLKQTEEFSKKLLLQKESYLKAIVETQEEERKRIAKDLHDGVGQSLSGIKLAMVSIVSSMPATYSNEKHKLTELSQIVDNTCIEVRSISHQMMPRLLQEDGLIPSIADMLDKSFKLSNIEYNFEHYGMERRLKENIEIGVYRICQELINNIIKHSGATNVNVQLFRNGKIMVLLVEDNGKGFEFQNKKENGIGLLNISSRVETIHGEFNLEPSPHSGTLATIRIPIDTI